MNSLKQRYGSWAMITGASSGIGQEFAHQLAAQGFNLVLVARRKNELSQLASTLFSSHSTITRVISLDLLESDSIQTLNTLTEDLDIGLVIPAAGVDEMGAFFDNPIVSHQKVMKLNMEVPTQIAHTFGQRLQKRGGGGIIMISSLLAYQGTTFFSSYAASKSYILLLGEALNVELKQHNIDVLVVAPGLTQTPMASGIPIDWSQIPMQQQRPAAVVKTALSSIGKKASVVSGLLNKFYAWQNRLLPRITPTKFFNVLLSRGVKQYQTKNLGSKSV